MTEDELLASWQREEEQPFSGWDFSYLNGRMVEDPLPWSYAERAAALLQRASHALDMDTGGGERLLSLRRYWPARMVASENYPPNVRLAGQRLAEAGAALVVATSAANGPLPFRAGAFDLVLNRHGGFNPAEIGRVLTPGGIFYTEQVHGLSHADLLAAFDATPPYPRATPERYVPQLQAAGLRIVALQSFEGVTTFKDVGAIVYYLRAVPWLVPGFSVATHASYLHNLHQRLHAEGSLTFAARAYLIKARAG